MNRNVPVTKNTTYTITARDISPEGHGIGSVDGFTVFCPGLLPGETAQVLIIKVLSSYAVGKLLEITNSSPDRVVPLCPVYQKCGGCTLSHMNYNAQLNYKEQHVYDCLKRIGKIEHFTMEPIIPCPTDEKYRNKAQYRFGMQDGHVCCGFYREHSHNLVPTSECRIEAPGTDKIRRNVCKLANDLGYTVYEEASHKGLLRSLLIRTSQMTGGSMVILIINGKALPQEKDFIQKLTAACPEVCSLYVNSNTRAGNTVLGEHFRKLWGEDKLKDAIGEAEFYISPGAFYQVNSHQVKNLYETAAEFSGVDREMSLLDLYCGVGTIGIYIARTSGVKQLYGVEYIEKAIADAKENAALNGLSNCVFKAGDVGKMLTEDGPTFKPQVVVVDPPRKGCDRKALEQIAGLSPNRIVYVSCNPATLARDAAVLEELGYRCERVRPVDMFPGTGHVESVCLFSKLHAKQKIEVELAMSEMDLTVAESKATYEEIKDYVLNHTGLKVSNLYIAQIKQKCGIIERVNYNKAKSENSRQPKCPAEKEKAIREALEHFQMI